MNKFKRWFHGRNNIIQIVLFSLTKLIIISLWAVSVASFKVYNAPIWVITFGAGITAALLTVPDLVWAD